MSTTKRPPKPEPVSRKWIFDNWDRLIEGYTIGNRVHRLLGTVANYLRTYYPTSPNGVKAKESEDAGDSIEEAGRRFMECKNEWDKENAIIPNLVKKSHEVFGDKS